MHSFALEESADASADTVTVILACDAFSVAGTYNKRRARLVGKWATSPRAFKTKQIKSECEQWLATQDLG